MVKVEKTVPTPVPKTVPVSTGLLKMFRPVRKSLIRPRRSMLELARNPDLAGRFLPKM